jgi:mannose-6-phosphate isomerase-like protein (cupin superfamily)
MSGAPDPATAPESGLRVQSADGLPEGASAVHPRRVFTTESAGFESCMQLVLRNRINAGEANTRHVHADVEKVYYIISGAAEVECGSERRTIQGGDFLFFPAAVPHAIRCLGPQDLEFIVIQAKVHGTPRGQYDG